MDDSEGSMQEIHIADTVYIHPGASDGIWTRPNSLEGYHATATSHLHKPLLNVAAHALPVVCIVKRRGQVYQRNRRTISPLLLHMVDELCSNPVFNELSARYTDQLNICGVLLR